MSERDPPEAAPDLIPEEESGPQDDFDDDGSENEHINFAKASTKHDANATAASAREDAHLSAALRQAKALVKEVFGPFEE